MSPELWIEVDIRLKDVKRINEVLLDFVDGFIQGHVRRVTLWHFLREKSPITDEPEIRLRFLGEEKEIEHIRVTFLAIMASRMNNMKEKKTILERRAGRYSLTF